MQGEEVRDRMWGATEAEKQEEIRNRAGCSDSRL